MNQNSFDINFSALNPAQQKAVLTTEGRVLILAGAGSGKTKVLTFRMSHLIKNVGIAPHAILGLTFTNKAAAEMRHRIGKMLEPTVAKKITLCTFHSFCMQVLRQDIHHLGYTSNFTLYGEKEMQRLVTLIARDELQHEGTLPSLRSTLQAIVDAQNKGEDEQEIDTAVWHNSFVQQIQHRLKASMRAYNALDFDHLILLTVELFENHPHILQQYQERFQYIMIDEYQDTNIPQYRLAQLLSQKHNRLCVVGDDDQSIYGWRGAEVKHILGFDNATVVKLEQNYRSTNIILTAANGVISNNKQRHDKKMWSAQKQGPLIEVFHAPTAENEVEAVIHRLALLRTKANLRWSECAILYRSNNLARPFESALLKYTWQENSQWHRGIPYHIYGGQEFYERREIKDLTAYLRIIANPLDQDAILRVLNVPRRQIGENTLDQLTQINRTLEVPLWDILKQAYKGDFFSFNAIDFSTIPTKALKGITHFIDTIEQAREQFQMQPLHQALQWLVDTINYKQVIAEEVKSQKMRDFKWDNVQEFIRSVEEYEIEKKTEDFAAQPSVQDFITTMSLNEQELFGKKTPTDKNHVHLMTFHSAKGLEFSACFLIGIEDHIIPHEKSHSLEEERRLMYVALTRAKKHLCCSMARKRKYMSKETETTPSRFLLEVPKTCLQPTKWNFPLLQ